MSTQATRPELSSSASSGFVLREVLIDYLHELSEEGRVSGPGWTANKIVVCDGLVHFHLGVSAASCFDLRSARRISTDALAVDNLSGRKYLCSMAERRDWDTRR
jgi:hypothetical protein